MGIFIIFLIANLTDIYWRERESRSCPIAGKLELGQDIKAFIFQTPSRWLWIAVCGQSKVLILQLK